MPGTPLALDASMAILLAKVDLLSLVVGRVETWMTTAAFAEATVKETDDARAIRLLVETNAIRCADPRGDPRRIEEDFRLGAGEAATIAWAQEHGAVCGTDDGPAIRCCRVLGVRFTSATALLAGLAEKVVVERELALEILTRLERLGRYDARIIEDVARKIRAGGREPRGEQP